jgi:hypothetical protein
MHMQLFYQGAPHEQGVARPDQVVGLTGLQMMQAMLRGEIPYPRTSTPGGHPRRLVSHSARVQALA